MSKGKRFLLIGLALIVLVFSSIACNETDNVPDTEADETFDEIAESAADGYNESLSTLCKLCRLSGDSNCSGVCR